MKVLRVDGGLRPHAWVRCRRPYGIEPYNGANRTCGWSWWSKHPDLVARAKRRPGMKLVRARKAVAVTRQDRKGAGGRG